MNLKANKSLGQNFLVDEKARTRIAEAAGVKDGDVVIEIGPGTGLLTKELLKLPLKKLIAYEVDDRAVELLREEIQDERFEVRSEDFLKADISVIARSGFSPRKQSTEKRQIAIPQGIASSVAEFTLSEANVLLPRNDTHEDKLKIVGNIPYYITSPILFKLIDDREHITDATLLIQLEVAERLTAEPRTKAYGIPTVLANFFGEVKMLFKVKAGCFRPVPNVDSALIKINFAKDYFTRSITQPPNDFEPKIFQTFVRTMFGMRRKMLRNNLKNFLTTEQLLLAANDPASVRYLTMRAEELDIEEFLKFYNTIEAFRKL